MNKMTLEKITIGEKVQLTSEAKNELVSKYKLTSGMSGINPADVNKEFVVKDFDGCNICVHTKNSEKTLYSFHYSRFKSKTGLN